MCNCQSALHNRILHHSEFFPLFTPWGAATDRKMGMQNFQNYLTQEITALLTIMGVSFLCITYTMHSIFSKGIIAHIHHHHSILYFLGGHPLHYTNAYICPSLLLGSSLPQCETVSVSSICTMWVCVRLKIEPKSVWNVYEKVREWVSVSCRNAYWFLLLRIDLHMCNIAR